MDTYIPKYIHTCIIHTYTPTYIHTYIHTYIINISSHHTLSLWLEHPQTHGLGLLKLSAYGARIVLFFVFYLPMACMSPCMVA